MHSPGLAAPPFHWHAALASRMLSLVSWLHCGMHFVAGVLIGVGLSKLIEIPTQRPRERPIPA